MVRLLLDMVVLAPASAAGRSELLAEAVMVVAAGVLGSVA